MQRMGLVSVTLVAVCCGASGRLSAADTQAQPVASSPDTLVPEVRKLSAARDNDARFDALTALLQANDLQYTVEPVQLEKPTSGDEGARDPRVQGRNVVVTFGNGPEVVVVGAHYDAVWIADKTLSRGAVDNGASSVMLVHAAQALRTQRLARQIRFVWFDFEESGLLGSADYVKHHAADRIVAMLNYDINAYGDTVLYGPPKGGANTQLARSMVEACVDEGVDCVRFDGLPPGDDRSFGARNIPSLSIALLPATEVHQLWLMLFAKGAGLAPGFAPPIFGTIHSPGDLPEKVQGADVARAQRLAVALIRRVGSP